MNRLVRTILMVSCGVLLLVGATGHAERGDLLPDQWNIIAPEGATQCADGTPYEFFVYPGASDRLHIYFQGGGACWDARTCDPAGFPTYDAEIEPSPGEDMIDTGIFDLTNPQNPLAEHTHIFVSYCSADLHMGDAQTRYADDITLAHRGAVNAQAALDWAAAAYPAPDAVFITGCSAGGYGALFHTPAIAAQYPDARVAQLTDAAAGVTPPGWDGAANWRTDDLLSMTDEPSFGLYERAFEAVPRGFFGLFNYADDPVQAFFYGLQGGEQADWEAEAQARLDTLLARYDNLAAFIVDDTGHCGLPEPEFYTLQTDDQSFVAWVGQLARQGTAPTVLP